MNTETILNFLAENYIYFMIGAGVLLVALIGFIIGGKKDKKKEEEVQMDSMNTVPQNTQVQPQSVVEQPVQSNVIQNNNIVPQQSNTVPTLDDVQNNITQPNETIFTGAPVNSVVNELSTPVVKEEPKEQDSASLETEEKLVIEPPSGTLSENVDIMKEEMPNSTSVSSTPVQDNVQSNPQETIMFEQPFVEEKKEEIIVDAPVMEANEPLIQPQVSEQPKMDIPMQEAPQVSMERPIEPSAPMYNNTIQQ